MSQAATEGKAADMNIDDPIGQRFTELTEILEAFKLGPDDKRIQVQSIKGREYFVEFYRNMAYDDVLRECETSGLTGYQKDARLAEAKFCHQAAIDIARDYFEILEVEWSLAPQGDCKATKYFPKLFSSLNPPILHKWNRSKLESMWVNNPTKAFT